jgi:hypothetical protein
MIFLLFVMVMGNPEERYHFFRSDGTADEKIFHKAGQN